MVCAEKASDVNNMGYDFNTTMTKEECGVHCVVMGRDLRPKLLSLCTCASFYASDRRSHNPLLLGFQERVLPAHYHCRISVLHPSSSIHPSSLWVVIFLAGQQSWFGNSLFFLYFSDQKSCNTVRLK